MTIIPITKTLPEWNYFVKGCQKLLGYSPTRSIDSLNLQPASPESFLCSLAYFRDQDDDPHIIKQFTLEHVYLSFLIEINEQLYMELLEKNFKINYLRSNECKVQGIVVAIVSATLFNWRNICVNFNESYLAKEFSFKIYELLKGCGYTNIFNEYRLSENVDGSKSFERR